MSNTKALVYVTILHDNLPFVHLLFAFYASKNYHMHYD